MKTFSELIRERRIEQGLTVRSLEARLKHVDGTNVSRSLISLLENGKRLPTYEVAYQLAQALEIDPSEILAATFKSRVGGAREKEVERLGLLVRQKRLSDVDLSKIIGPD